ncbi:MAG: rRNA maturation RNase YbeY [SAR202 cluster bacterium]|nr:rRNA maturation RNase YbeY [SAR202 cluster bacterium]
MSDHPQIPSYPVAIQVFDEFLDLVSQSLVDQFSRAALKVGQAPKGTSVSVAITDDEVVRDLNARHRGLDEYTDVLSFSYTHHGHFYGNSPSQNDQNPEVEFVAPGAEDSLGEVIISYPQAERQAMEIGHSINRELSALVTHGILHLLGHDHEESTDRTNMEQLEKEAIKIAGVIETTQ